MEDLKCDVCGKSYTADVDNGICEDCIREENKQFEIDTVRNEFVNDFNNQ